MAEIGIPGLVGLVASSSVIAAGLTGVIQSRIEKSRREADRNERRRDEHKELYVRFRAALDAFGSSSVTAGNPLDRARLMDKLISTTVEMNLLAPDDVSSAAKRACHTLVAWRLNAEMEHAKATTESERERVVKDEWSQRQVIEASIENVTALMRAELLRD